MKKIILLTFLLIVNYSFSQTNTKTIKSTGSSSLGYQFEYECDLVYRLETTIADGYKNNPSGVRFAIKNLKITDVIYQGIRASSIDNITLPKTCDKVSGATVSGTIILNKGNKTYSTPFTDDHIDYALNVLSLYEFEDYTKKLIMTKFGEDVTPSDLNTSLRKIKVNVNLSGGNCSSSIVSEIKGKISLDKRIKSLQEKAEALNTDNKSDLLKKKSIYENLASIDEEDDYSYELENVEKEMKKLANEELDKEEEEKEEKENKKDSNDGNDGNDEDDSNKKEIDKTKKKNKENDGDEDDYDKIKEKEKEKKEKMKTQVSLMLQYDNMLKKAQNLKSNNKSNTQEYKDLIKSMRRHELALRIPRHLYYDNPGFIQENTMNTHLNKAAKNINDYKQRTNAAVDGLNDIVQGFITASANKKGLERRERSLAWNKKEKIQLRDRFVKSQQEVYREKIMISTMVDFDEKTTQDFYDYSSEKQNEVIKNAYKYINYNRCPSPVCNNGERREYLLERQVCSDCKGKKTLHNHGCGGGYLNAPTNFMSCTQCLGTGTEMKLNTKKGTCELCKGEDVIFEYVGSDFLPNENIRQTFKDNKEKVNSFIAIRKSFDRYEKIKFLPFPDLNLKRIGFIDRNLKVTIEPSYFNANLVTFDKASVNNGTKWGLINTENELLLPFEYNKISNRNDTLVLYKEKKVFTAKLDGTNIEEKEVFVENEFKDKDDNVIYKLLRVKGELAFSDAKNNIISNKLEEVVDSVNNNKFQLLKLNMANNSFKLFDFKENVLSPQEYDSFTVGNYKRESAYAKTENLILNKGNKKGFYCRAYDEKKDEVTSYFSNVEYYDLIFFPDYAQKYALVNISENENKYGVINGVTGEWILEPIYDYIFTQRFDYETTFVARKIGDKKRKASRYNTQGVFLHKVKLPK